MLIDRFGADTARLYVMFAGPPQDSAVWSDTGVDGASRFLKRLWAFAQARHATVAAAPATFDYRDADDAVRKARRDLHMTLKQADDDFNRIHYNTVVSAGMIMLNTLEARAGRRTRRRCAGARGPVAGAAGALPRHPAHDVGAVERARARSRVRRSPRCALAAGRCRGARAGRNRARAAGERQVARQDRRAGDGNEGSDRKRGARQRRSCAARKWGPR